MLLFLIGMAILVIGYFTYGKLVEKILGPDDRPTPCQTCCDGVDYVRLPHWKNMLIQLLNIAGVGPVIGVILGIFLIAKIIEFIFSKAEIHAYYAIIGLILASPIAILLKTDWSGFSILTLVIGLVTFAAGWFVSSKLGGE